MDIAIEKQKEQNALKFLTFKLGKETYAFPVAAIKEVIDCIKIAHVPRSAAYMKGIINIRGSIVPVVDMRLLFSLEGVKNGRAKDGENIIVAEIAESGGASALLGMLAEKPLEVIEIAEEAIEPAGKLNRADFVKEIGAIENRFILILDIYSIVHYLEEKIEASKPKQTESFLAKTK